MRFINLSASITLCLVGATAAVAQSASDTVVTTTPGTDVRLGAYAVFKRDCSGGAAAQVRPAGDQHGGIVAISNGTLSTSRIPNCGTVQAPAQIVTYRPNPDFTGTDKVTYDVIDPATGKAQTHSVTVKVAP